MRFFLALSVLALLLFARPIVRDEVLTLRDHSDYFQPLRLFTNQELRRGHLPLWNPYNASGEPWLANPQTGVFYPPAWIFVVVPFARAYTLFLAIHVALLGCGAFALLRRFASPPAALLGAITLMLCGPSLSLLDVSNTLTTFAWLPLVLWCALAHAPVVLSAVTIAMSFLAGEPFFAALGAVMFVVWSHVGPPPTAADRRGRRSYIFDVALTSFALSAVQLLPFLEWVKGSDRAGGTAASEILRNSMPPQEWLHVFFGGSSRQQFIPVIYVGVVASLLAFVAIGARWRQREVRFAVGLLAFAVVVAAGSYLRPVAWLLTHMPITLFRYPARMLPIGALAIAILAAIGWDAIAPVMRYSWVPYALAMAIVADMTPRVAPLLASGPFNPHPTPYDVRFARDGKIIRLLTDRTFDRRQWIAGYTNLFERRFDSWTAAPVVSERYVRAYEEALRDEKRRREMSIGYVISNTGAGVQMVRDAKSYPLAYWRGDDGAASGAALFALTTTALHATIDAPRDGTVIITQQRSHGWRVTVDGVPARAMEGELFCAVRVKQGRHAVSWRYRPSSLIVGALITAIGFLRVALSRKFVKGSEEKFFFAMQLQHR